MTWLALGLLFHVAMVIYSFSLCILVAAIIAIASGQLMSILVDINSSLVNVINSFIATGQFTFTASNYETWNRAGSKTTEDTVTALAQLYQRQLEAAPLRLNLPSVELNGFRTFIGPTLGAVITKVKL